MFFAVKGEDGDVFYIVAEGMCEAYVGDGDEKTKVDLSGHFLLFLVCLWRSCEQNNL